MYATCIYCHKPLGANEIVEHFPVGRRLAFDAAKGRLWVVCRKCERWNLSPLETRWEAIEECERRFHDTRLRVSTDNIGLARLSEGLELVRIGEPLRPEFAAWRYGDQFGRRRRRVIVLGTGVAVGVGAVIVGASAAGVGIGGFGGLWGQLPNILSSMRSVKLKTPDGRVIKVRGSYFPSVVLQRSGDSGEPQLSFKPGRHIESFHGEAALRLAGQLLPAINYSGGSKRTVADAVRDIEDLRGPEAYLAQRLPLIPPLGRKLKQTPVAKLAAPHRLAIEMALHEEAERRAIEGELELLEEAWREAEEIAAIADNLLVPERVEEQLVALKRRAGGLEGSQPRGADT
jgi:hypothetical protein